MYLAPGWLGGLLWDKVVLFVITVVSILCVSVIQVPILSPPPASLCGSPSTLRALSCSLQKQPLQAAVAEPGMCF